MKISDKNIGLDSAPFIIAEMSGNHNQSLERAIEIVDAGAKAGVHAIKLQTYTADTLTLDLSEGEFFIDQKENLWNGKSLYELYQKAYTPWEWHEPIMQRAKELGMICFSSPFDETAVDFLEELDVPAYKIASFEIVHLPLIKKVAATKKPLFISTGLATISEIDEAVKTIREAGCDEIVLFKCTSTYPASPENSNVLTIPHMRDLFNCEIGLSDHTLGLGAAIAGIAFGATVIEKHFTLSREDGGVDSAFSLEPEEMQRLVVESKRAWQALGKVTYGPTKAESKSVLRRRSLYIADDIKKGDTLTEKNMRIVRPGLGLPPKDVKKGTAVGWRMIE